LGRPRGRKLISRSEVVNRGNAEWALQEGRLAHGSIGNYARTRTDGRMLLVPPALASTSGPGLSLTVCSSPVCHSCGKKHAPVLAALRELGRVADRVGRIGRHSPLLPLRTLLDLAHVAERYADSHETRGCEEGSVQAVSRHGLGSSGTESRESIKAHRAAARSAPARSECIPLCAAGIHGGWTRAFAARRGSLLWFRTHGGNPYFAQTPARSQT
jgi:hypothetical protein